jgi:BirA family biotin operon repressor/biotin-[acetyl-CoA-carboxylase] ligase
MIFERFHFPEISSTNEYIKELIPDYDILAVSADHQTAGRGRNGKSWEGSYGKNIYLSIGLNFNNRIPFANPGIYQAEACLIVKDVLDELYYDFFFKIKYPNDILALDTNNNYLKICGILIENSYTANKLENIIIGIGINCDQTDFPEHLIGKAASLKLIGAIPDKELITQRIIEKYKINFENPEISYNILKKWQNELNLANKDIKVIGDNSSWRLKKFFDDGRLLLTSNSSEKIIDNGDSIIYDIS